MFKPGSRKDMKTADQTEGFWPKVDREMASELRLTEPPAKGKDVWTPNGPGKVMKVHDDQRSITVQLETSGELRIFTVNRLRKIEGAIRKVAEHFSDGDTVALKPEFGKRGIVLYLTPYQDYMVAWSGGSMQRINPELLMKVSKRLVKDADKLREKYSERTHKTTVEGGLDDNVILEMMSRTDFASPEDAIQSALERTYDVEPSEDDIQRVLDRVEQRGMTDQMNARFQKTSKTADGKSTEDLWAEKKSLEDKPDDPRHKEIDDELESKLRTGPYGTEGAKTAQPGPGQMQITITGEPEELEQILDTMLE